MDVGSIVKDNVVPLGRFLLRQFTVWVTVVRDPAQVVSRAGIESRQSLLPALALALFAYLLTLLVAFPRLLLAGLDTSATAVYVADFVLTFMGFVLIGVTLYAVGRLLGGRGGFLPSLAAGLYLSAFWPIVQCTDYLLAPDLSRLGLSVEAAVFVHMGLLAAVSLVIVGWITTKAAPVIRYVHGLGRVRAAIAVILQMLVVALAIFIYLEPLFRRLLEID